MCAHCCQHQYLILSLYFDSILSAPRQTRVSTVQFSELFGTLAGRCQFTASRFPRCGSWPLAMAATALKPQPSTQTCTLLRHECHIRSHVGTLQYQALLLNMLSDMFVYEPIC